MLSSTSVFSYMMPSKPLAVKSSSFKLPKQRSSTATSLWCRVECRYGTKLHRRRISQYFFQNAGLLLWRHRGLGGRCIWASFGPAPQEARQPCRRRVCKGDEFNKAAPAPPAPAAPAPAAWENGARPADELPTPPAGEGDDAGAGDPAPGEGAVPRPAAASQTAAADEK